MLITSSRVVYEITSLSLSDHTFINVSASGDSAPVNGGTSKGIALTIEMMIKAGLTEVAQLVV